MVPYFSGDLRSQIKTLNFINELPRKINLTTTYVVFLLPMLFLYNLGIFLLNNSIKLASLFHPKAKAFVDGRRGALKKIDKLFQNNTSPIVWIHCASLGEFEQGRPIIEALKKDYPTHKIFLTFFSPSGFEVRKDYALADFVFYLPWDTSKHAKKLINNVKPVLAIFVKYEFWFHYTRELKKRNIPLISVSSIFRKDQLFFQQAGGFNRRILKNFSFHFVQNQESLRLLQSIGITNCVQAGDTRFDRVARIVQQNQTLPVAERFKNKQKIFVVGSCWPDDLDVLIPFINENRLKFIIAPHEISEERLNDFEKALQVRSIRYSEALTQNPEDFNVLVIDNIGMLSKLYRYGEFAYVGGAFGKGLHNILEAACYGIPVLFGNKNYEKFQEAVDLINRGGAFAIADYPDLKEKYEMLNVAESFLLACEVTRQYVQENLGATEKVMRYCQSVLQKNFANN
jgi:3-deoxy-D-manno-octulosonic-acid transferase